MNSLDEEVWAMYM